METTGRAGDELGRQDVVQDKQAVALSKQAGILSAKKKRRIMART